MDFLKNILVSVPGLGGMPVHTGCPEWPGQGRSQTTTPRVTWQGALVGCGGHLSLGEGETRDRGD